MKTSTTDKVEGTIHKMKGEVKETVGQITNDPYLEAEGTIEKAEGKTQEKVGQIKKVLGK
ncbi:CsbD family protein [uncultured Methanomethylovorans sp.]|uniref:CsbD family protein n=1 Tax=uncultured Methanomethylovorans sp. TaxID=183759 RepID=UPI002AA750C6|nr:CsbD family protein [uncultured Methanomethylovorans sp.]